MPAVRGSNLVAGWSLALKSVCVNRHYLSPPRKQGLAGASG
jgi:hypothetical protein